MQNLQLDTKFYTDLYKLIMSFFYRREICFLITEGDKYTTSIISNKLTATFKLTEDLIEKYVIELTVKKDNEVLSSHSIPFIDNPKVVLNEIVKVILASITIDDLANEPVDADWKRLLKDFSN